MAEPAETPPKGWVKCPRETTAVYTRTDRQGVCVTHGTKMVPEPPRKKKS